MAAFLLVDENRNEDAPGVRDRDRTGYGNVTPAGRRKAFKGCP